MGHSYSLCAFHVVFSTTHRFRILRKDLLPRLADYTVGIGRKKHIHVYAVGGMDDHLHLLIAIPPAMPLSTAIQTLKGNTSRWLNQTREMPWRFEWQEGYGAFSVSASLIPVVKRYIARQATHHRKMTFQEEFLAFLKKHNIAYDPKHVWG